MAKKNSPTPIRLPLAYFWLDHIDTGSAAHVHIWDQQRVEMGIPSIFW